MEQKAKVCNRVWLSHSGTPIKGHVENTAKNKCSFRRFWLLSGTSHHFKQLWSKRKWVTLHAIYAECFHKRRTNFAKVTRQGPRFGLEKEDGEKNVQKYKSMSFDFQTGMFSFETKICLKFFQKMMNFYSFQIYLWKVYWQILAQFFCINWAQFWLNFALGRPN